MMSCIHVKNKTVKVLSLFEVTHVQVYVPDFSIRVNAVPYIPVIKFICNYIQIQRECIHRDLSHFILPFIFGPVRIKLNSVLIRICKIQSFAYYMI